MKACTFFVGILVTLHVSGKILDSRSGRTDRAQRGPWVVTESKIFSRPARPHSVNKHFIISPFFSIFIFLATKLVRIVFSGPYAFFQAYHLDAYGPRAGTFFSWFSKEIARGAVLFLSAEAGKMNRFLQSDWFWERVEFSDSVRGQRNEPDAVVCVTIKVSALCNFARQINFYR